MDNTRTYATRRPHLPEGRTNRDKQLWHRYKLSEQDYDQMVEAQGGLCALCLQPPKKDRALHVDHDHECCSGRKTCGECTRALLCFNCNANIIGIPPAMLKRALEYLESYGDLPV